MTVPVAIGRLMSRPGSAGFGQAMALSCVLMLLCALVLALVDRLAGDDGVRVAVLSAADPCRASGRSPPLPTVFISNEIA